MYLQPVPRSYIEKEGQKFLLELDREIILSTQCNLQDLESAKLLKKTINDLIGINLKINKSYVQNYSEKSIRLSKEEGYRLSINEERVEIKATTSKGLFYGVQTFIQIIKNEGVELSPVIIEDSPYFKNRGYYHDVTRGKCRR